MKWKDDFFLIISNIKSRLTLYSHNDNQRKNERERIERKKIERIKKRKMSLAYIFFSRMVTREGKYMMLWFALICFAMQDKKKKWKRQGMIYF